MVIKFARVAATGVCLGRSPAALLRARGGGRMPATTVSTASDKVRAPSRSMTLERCISTVRRLTPSCLPIVLFVPPASSPSKACRSCAEIPAMRRSADSLTHCSMVVCWMLAVAEAHGREQLIFFVSRF